jgi:hypothetical protein
MLRTPFELTWKNLRIKHANVANAQYGGGKKLVQAFLRDALLQRHR